MNRYFANLPKELAEFTSTKEPVIQLISSRHCPNYDRPCKEKCNNDGCCLGEIKCGNECPNCGQCPNNEGVV